MSEGFRNVPGVPDGWELVEVRKIKQGDFSINGDGKPFKWMTCESDAVWPIIRKIEQPAKYRHFANAEEFKPHRDRWVRHKDDTPDAAFRVLEYRDSGVMNISGEPMYFADAFSELFFDDDGTPFGVKIDE
jgi:hypothetical protein